MGKKADTIAAEFEDFKRRVRAEALRVKREQGYCEEGTNEVLRRLGLPEIGRFTVPVTVTQPAPEPRQWNVVVEDALSREDAFRRLREDAREARRLVASQLGIHGALEITVPEPPDPTRVPAVGSRPEEGPWYEPNANRWCNVYGLNRNMWVCSRRSGHDGVHVASSTTRVLEVWGGESADAEAPADPAAVPTVGSARPPEGTWYVSASETGGPNQCRAWDPTRVFYCTRPAGHTEGPHVAAGNSAGVRAVGTEGWTERTPFVSGQSTERPDSAFENVDDEDEYDEDDD